MSSRKRITARWRRPTWARATSSFPSCAGSASKYAVISPSSDVAATIARTGLAAPLDIAKLPSYAQLSPRLRDLPLVKANGRVYGVPFMWGPNPLLYDTTAFAQAPDSWAALWNTKLKG